MAESIIEAVLRDGFSVIKDNSNFSTKRETGKLRTVLKNNKFGRYMHLYDEYVDDVIFLNNTDDFTKRGD